jgi:hypothetical protein
MKIEEIETYAKIPEGWRVVGFRAPKAGECYLGMPNFLGVSTPIECIVDDYLYRMVVKRNTKNVKLVTIEILDVNSDCNYGPGHYEVRFHPDSFSDSIFCKNRKVSYSTIEVPA